MGYQSIFKRYELKYLISREQYVCLKMLLSEYMVPDKYGKSTICNIYFDTTDRLLIRRSIEKPEYKEKLRWRSYGVADDSSETFIELKKKYESVVYKRRVAFSNKEAEEYLIYRKNKLNELENNNGPYKTVQIIKEIDYIFSLYQGLMPAEFISYEREAFYGKQDREFRLTFDQNILCRDYDLDLRKGIYGQKILKDDEIILEVKTATAIPLWLTKYMSDNHIYKTSFSKYGTIYKKRIQNTEGEYYYVRQNISGSV